LHLFHQLHHPFLEHLFYPENLDFLVFLDFLDFLDFLGYRLNQ
jgi:hypothetical protein